MIQLSDHAEGCTIPVRAQAGARKAGVVGTHAGALKLAVREPAQDGRANQALTDLLRHILNLKRSQIALIGGLTSRDKLFLIRAISKEKLQGRLAAILGPLTKK